MPSAVDYGVESVLETVTDVFGLSGSERGNEYDMLCVSPDHDDSTASCAVNLTTGYWHCFSCGVGGDLAKLGSVALSIPISQVIGMLTPTSPEAKLLALQRKVTRLVARPCKAKTPVLHLPEYTATEPMNYIRSRGFSDDSIGYWGLRWVRSEQFEGQRGRYEIANVLGIPIRNQTGHLAAWCYRSTERSLQWQPRYLYTPGAEVSEMWFGVHKHAQLRHVAIVEGALDAMWLTQCGYPALALLGSKMGDRKIAWLQQYQSITLVPDLDSAGLKWMTRVGGMLAQRMPVQVARYRPWMMARRPRADGSYSRATDPEEMHPVDVELMMESAVPYAVWQMSNNNHPTF